ncbi:DNA protecting protein DprA [Labilibaculum filiforme]|uniref:DNA protecting protein DprA n=1 Tax=Labilibaculum filiforme TaxID=1940526 RepID=A0A2N3HSM5_9BACT|nr:DNA-processing protein DprA [Labilibaculum filiforme]PKQ61049.1 DNA protecting protein DprA [Labilibaculum filiforme]
MEDIYKIAISFLNGIGPVNTKKVIAYTGSVEGLFKEKKQNLLKIPGIGPSFLDKLDRDAAIQLAEEEQKFIADNHIKVSFYLEKNYPQRLLNCSDSPCTLYYKGTTDFNVARTISIVGTRNASDYGREVCNKLIQDLAQKEIKPLIISGLAYGVDICAHKAALRNQLQTVAAVGHGLHMMYPSQHKRYADEIVNQGALISEFTSKSKFDPKNFVRRNRIIAGMADATIVIESASKGGSLVTADIANSYNRDVFAFPGRISDKGSTGCNKLIKTNQAHLIEGVADLEYILGWENRKGSPKTVQTKLFIELSPDEESLVQALKEKDHVPIDILSLKTSFPMSKVSSLLLKLEFDGLIKSLPGKIYALNT